MSDKKKMDKTEIIRNDRSFQRIFRKGKRYESESYIIYLKPREHGFQIGIRTVRSFGSAVNRNLARRIAREIIRLNKFRIKKAIEIVLIAKKNAICNTFECNRIELEELFKRTGMIK